MEELLNQIPRSTAYQLVYYPPGKLYPNGEFVFDIFVNDGKEIKTYQGASRSYAVDAIQDAIDKMRGKKNVSS